MYPEGQVPGENVTRLVVVTFAVTPAQSASEGKHPACGPRTTVLLRKVSFPAGAKVYVDAKHDGGGENALRGLYGMGVLIVRAVGGMMGWAKGRPRTILGCRST